MARRVSVSRLSFLAVLVGSLCAAYLPGVRAQQPVTAVPLAPSPPPLVVDGLEILPVQGGVHMIVGAGGNVAVQIGEEGVFVEPASAASVAGWLKLQRAGRAPDDVVCVLTGHGLKDPAVIQQRLALPRPVPATLDGIAPKVAIR